MIYLLTPVKAEIVKQHKIYFYIVALILWTQLSLAQSISPPLSLDVFPATPNAAALAKFGDVPVGLAAGIPSVTVPIYSYKGAKLSFNVSLDYHAGGIKVEEVASDVGIGWALSAGGMVSRTVRGRPDDLKGIGYFYLGGLSEFGTYLDLAVADQQITSADSLWLFYKNHWDSQSDVFNYSINGKSGKFIYGLDGKYVTIPESKIKIERKLDPLADNHYSLTGFIITDTDGSRYEFMQHDQVHNTSFDNITAHSYPTTWNMTKIVAPFKTDSIALRYDDSYLTYDTGISESMYTYINGPYWTHEFDPDAARDYQVGQYSGTVKRLRQVSLPDSTNVFFNYEGVARRDIESNGALKEVIIDNRGNNYGYRLFKSYGANGAYVSGMVSSLFRLQLDSVVQFSGTEYLRPYKFTYNGNLPNRISTMQDHWGFTSGKASNSTLIPEIRFSGTNIIPGSDRTPDPYYAMSGSLVSVEYPTGGKTSFTFELNTGDSRLDYQEAELRNVSLGDLGVTERSFVLNRTSPTDPITFKLLLSAWCPGNPGDCNYIFRLRSNDGLTTYIEETVGLSDLSTVRTIPLGSMPNGTYKVSWEYEVPSHCACDDNFNLNLSWLQNSLNSERLAGGIRIKSMETYDGMSHANDMKTEYSYNFADGTSSGTMSLLPLYHYIYTAYTHPPESISLYASQWYYRSSSAYHPLSNINGAPVSYGMVTVKRLGPDGYLGKTVHEFTGYGYIGGMFSCSYDFGGNCPPFFTQPLRDYGLGLPTTETIFDKDGNKLKKTTNTYTMLQAQNKYILPNYRSFKYLLTGFEYYPVMGELNRKVEFEWSDFYIHSGRVEKLLERNVEYQGTDSLVNSVNYAYDQDNYNLKSNYSFNSSGEKIERRYYYPYDYTVGGAIGKMRAEGVTDAIVAMEDWMTDAGNVTGLIGGIITDYGFYQGQLIRPSKYYRLEATQPLSVSTVGAFDPATLNRAPTYFTQQATYEKYGPKGNIMHYKDRGKVNTILWDYNGQYAVAQVENADSVSVAFTSFEADGSGDWSIGSSTRDLTYTVTGKKSYNLSSGNIAKTGLSSTMTYVVSYWSRNGAYSVTNGGTPTSGTTINGWTSYEHHVTGTATITISGSGNIDELRLYPLGRQMTTYAYDPSNGLSSSTDAKGMTTYYEYDSFQRLMNIKDQNGNIIKSYNYHYKP